MVIIKPEANKGIIRPKVGLVNGRLETGCKHYSHCGSDCYNQLLNLDTLQKLKGQCGSSINFTVDQDLRQTALKSTAGEFSGALVNSKGLTFSDDWVHSWIRKVTVAVVIMK